MTEAASSCRPSYSRQLGPEHVQSSALEQIQALCEDMSHVVISPDGQDQRPIADLRNALDTVFRTATFNAIQNEEVRAAVFSSLDPETIQAHDLGGEMTFAIEDWNRIAPHVTPEVITAFHAAGGRATVLPIFYPRTTPIPTPAAEQILQHLTYPDTPFIIRSIRAAEDGNAPPAYALKAIETWLAQWAPPAWHTKGTAAMTRALTILRLIAALRGWRGDDWTPLNAPDCARALELTRSAHGRLELSRRLTDLEGLLRHPEKTIADLVK